MVSDSSRMFWRVLLLAVFLPVAASALPNDEMIEGAKQCTRYLPRYERQYGIPVHLLAAIASTESGRWHNGLHILLPWPWTINADGKSYYYGSKEDAVRAAHNMLSEGAHNVDVGCMQVSLQQHPHAFASMEEAFDPEHNIAYASSFLRTLYDEQHTWHAAAAAYHSKTPSYGEPYVNHVYDHWNTILERIRLARLNMAKSMGGVASGDGLTKGEDASAREVSAAGGKPLTLANLAPGARQADGLLMRPHESLDVQASAAPAPVQTAQPATGIVPPVVVQSPRVKLADAQNLNSMAPAAGAADTARVVHINTETPATPPRGPHFIFND